MIAPTIPCAFVRGSGRAERKTLQSNCGPILIADGDRASRKLIRDALQNAGYPIVEATTGDDALTLANEHQPALVLLAVQLPGLCGYDVCRRLRATFGEQLPIIFLSGSRTEPMDRVAGLLVGADDYICKPFAPDELVARVARPLARIAQARSNGHADLIARLTPREVELLALLAKGKTPKAIAAELVISPKTVATHIQRILTKLDVHSRAEAVSLAYRNGLVGVEVAAHGLPATEQLAAAG